MRRGIAGLALLAAGALVVAIAASLDRSPAPTPTFTPEPASSTDLAEFVRTNQLPSIAAPAKHGWLLRDVMGWVVRAEDESQPLAVLTRTPTLEVSHAGRHLSYWTNEAKGVRQLHVFDTVALEAPRVVFETAEFGKVPLSWSTDEQFLALPLLDRPGLARLIHVSSGRWLEATAATIAALPLWGGARARPQADPGTSMPVVAHKFTRLDGSATTYLTFDSSAGGRWYGERVEVATGKRTPVQWDTGGNPQDVLWVGTATPAHHDAAPPLDVDGKITAARALWLVRQNASAPVTREAVRSMSYGEYFDAMGGGGLQIPRDLIVHAVVLQTESQPGRGGLREAQRITCRSTFALVRSDGRLEGTGGGCSTELWPPKLPPAFGAPHPLDWTSPLGPRTPAPSPSVVR